MKLTKTIAACLLATCGTIGLAMAGPPLDRPTPPPCCADGVCFAHSHAFGYFPTRWRTWPAPGVAPTPAAPTPAVRPIPDVPAYEVPSPETEDQKAPPPTTTPSEDSAGSTPGAPLPPGIPVPPTTPLESFGPMEGEGNSTTPFLPTPFLPPATSPVPSIPTPTPIPGGGGEPLSDLDPPPAPPFAPLGGGPMMSFAPQRAPASAQPANRMNGTPKTTPAARPRSASSADPPPLPPLTAQAAIY